MMIIVSVLYRVCGGCGQRCHAIACSLCSCTAGYFNPFNSEFLASNPPQSRYDFFGHLRENFFSLGVSPFINADTYVMTIIIILFSAK